MTPTNKLYYSIAEVSGLLGVPQSTLRWWESEIPEFSPMRTKGGQRRYRREDVETAGKIKLLSQDKGWSLDAVSEFLRNSAAPKRRPTCRNRQQALNLVAELEKLTINSPKCVAILQSLRVFVEQNYR